MRDLILLAILASACSSSPGATAPTIVTFDADEVQSDAMLDDARAAGDAGVTTTDDDSGVVPPGEDTGNVEPPSDDEDVCAPSGLEVRHRLTGFSRRFDADTTTGRALALDSVSPDLERVSYVDLSGPGGVVRSAPVSDGKLPSGALQGVVWQPRRQQFAMLVVHQSGPQIHLLELQEDGARITPLQSAGAPDLWLFKDLYAASDDKIVATSVFADGLAYSVITIDGTTATWGPLRHLVGGPDLVVADPGGGGLLGFGEIDLNGEFTSVAFQTTWDAGVWQRLDVAPVDDPEMLREEPAWLGFDPEARTLFVQGRARGFGGVPELRLFAADVSAAVPKWSAVGEEIDDYFRSGVFAHDANQRFLVFDGDSESPKAFSSVDGLVEPLDLDGSLGALPPRRFRGAAAMPGNRIVAMLESGALVTYDPADTSPRWEQFGDAVAPEPGHLVWDPVQAELLVLPVAGQFEELSTKLWRVADDGSVIAEESSIGGPPSYASCSMLVHEEQLIVTGCNDPVSDAPLGTVWSYDLRNRSWSQTAALPVARWSPTLMIVNDELWVIGGLVGRPQSDPVSVAEADALDLRSGLVRALDVAGEWPTRPRGSAVLGDSMVTIDDPNNVLLTLPPRSVFRRFDVTGTEGGEWSLVSDCYTNRVFREVISVPGFDGTSWWVGYNVFSVKPQP